MGLSVAHDIMKVGSHACQHGSYILNIALPAYKEHKDLKAVHTSIMATTELGSVLPSKIIVTSVKKEFIE